jgi:large subunit ribosomal protein L21
MYAIIQSGGHQYRVAEGETIEVERLAATAGDGVEFDQVLLVGGDSVRVGRPFVEGAVVRGTVLGDVRAKKLVVFKYKPKNRYRIKTGHRQSLTRVQIDSIQL